MIRKKTFSQIKTIISTLHIAHWFVIFLSLGLTLFAWSYSKEQVSANVQMQFEKQANQIIHLVIERMEKYEDALRAGVAKIYADKKELSYKNWKSYVESLNILEKYPGINGMGIIYKVPSNKVKDFLIKKQKEQPGFNIYPKHKKPLLLPITYIIPTKGNEKAIGLDMAFEKNRFSAATKAKQTGTAQLTGPIVLVQDKEKTPGFLLFVPFYKLQHLRTEKARDINFIGLVYAPFIMKKLMNGTLAKKNSDIRVKITDGKSILFNDSKNQKDNTASIPPQYHKKVNVEVYGRIWTFYLSNQTTFIKATKNNQPNIILFAGLIIDSLLLLLFLHIANTRKKAIDYATALNKDLDAQVKSSTILNKRLELALSTSSIGVWEYDISKGKYIWDKGMYQLYDVPNGQFDGSYQQWEENTHPEDRAMIKHAINLAILKSKKIDITFRTHLPNKKTKVLKSLADVIIENGIPKKIVGINIDITTLKEKEAQLEHLAKYDSLSQLKNRHSFNESFFALYHAAKKDNHQFALILIDIDDFKQINDLYGHKIGDAFISHLSNTLRNVCRNRDAVFRLGGDEFAILSDFITDISIAEDMGERILASLHTPLETNEHEVRGSCSIGISVYPTTGDTIDELMINADIALYKSKEKGKNCVHFFTESLNDKAKRLRFIKNNLVNAANEDEIYMNYQPIINLNDKKTVIIEALCRWDSKIGPISPDEFISVAEKCNTINILGQSIIKKITKDISQDNHHYKVSINCSSKQLVNNTGFSKHLLESLNAANISPTKVILEITETYLIRDISKVSQTLNEIYQQGIEIAIDDFGTGYSSLSLLANIPFDYLKIDKTFVENIHQPNDLKILQCIYNVAKSLDKKIIAEGVETKAQLETLSQIGIYLIQGYYFSKPVPIQEVKINF